MTSIKLAHSRLEDMDHPVDHGDAAPAAPPSSASQGMTPEAGRGNILMPAAAGSSPAGLLAKSPSAPSTSSTASSPLSAAALHANPAFGRGQYAGTPVQATIQIVSVDGHGSSESSHIFGSGDTGREVKYMFDSPLTVTQFRYCLAAIMLVLALSNLDSTIVSTSLPKIASQLGGENILGWVVASYLMSSTAAGPLFGKLADIIGRKASFSSAIFIFMLGSVLCGMSTSMPMLVGMRAIQGAGAGAINSLVQIVAGDLVPPRQRGKYAAIIGIVFAVTSIAGPLFGGVFTDTIGWRWIFYINLPLGAIAFVLFLLHLNIPLTPGKHQVDYLGSLLVFGLVVPVGLGLTWAGEDYTWDSGVIVGLLVIWVVCIGLFLLTEYYAAEPILPLRFFRSIVFNITSIVTIVIGVVMVCVGTFLPVLLQVVWEYSAVMTGVLLSPMIGTVIVGAVVSGIVSTKTGHYISFPKLGSLIMVPSFFLLALMQIDTAYGDFLALILFLGLGVGLAMQMVILAMQNSVDQTDIAASTAALTFFRSLSGALGVAVFQVIFNNLLSDHLCSSIGICDSGGTRNPVNFGQLSPQQDRLAREAYATALSLSFLYVAPITVIGLVVSLFLPNIPLKTTLQPSNSDSERRHDLTATASS